MRLAVLGGGSWGTALAAHAVSAGHELRIWVRSPGVAAAIGDRRENPAYLPGIELPAGLRATTKLAEAVSISWSVTISVPFGRPARATPPASTSMPTTSAAFRPRVTMDPPARCTKQTNCRSPPFTPPET